MSLHGCLRCLKYFVFGLNFIVWVTGIAVLGIAIYLRMDPFTNHLVTTSHTQEVRLYHLVCYILIGAGGVMTFIGFLGCCSAFQESKCMLGTFFAFLLVLCAAEVASGVWAFLHRDKVKDSVTETMTFYIRNTYSEDPLINEPIDYVQSNGCGEKIIKQFNNRLFVVGLVALSLTGIQMLSLFFSIALCCGLCRQSAGGYKS